MGFGTVWLVGDLQAQRISPKIKEFRIDLPIITLPDDKMNET